MRTRKVIAALMAVLALSGVAATAQPQSANSVVEAKTKRPKRSRKRSRKGKKSRRRRGRRHTNRKRINRKHVKRRKNKHLTLFGQLKKTYKHGILVGNKNDFYFAKRGTAHEFYYSNGIKLMNIDSADNCYPIQDGNWSLYLHQFNIENHSRNDIRIGDFINQHLAITSPQSSSRILKYTNDFPGVPLPTLPNRIQNGLNNFDKVLKPGQKATVLCGHVNTWDEDHKFDDYKDHVILANNQGKTLYRFVYGYYLDSLD